MTDGGPPQRPAMDDAQRAAMSAARKRIDRVNGWLYLGGALPVEEYARLRDVGITHVVDLREDDEDDTDPVRLEALGIARHRAPVPNAASPTTEQLVEVAQWLDAKETDGKVYVHCIGGFGRAATVSVGLLILSGLSLEDAVQQVRQARPEVRLNSDQLAWLLSVEERGSGDGPR